MRHRQGVLAGPASPCLVKGKRLDPDALESYSCLLRCAKIRRECPEPQTRTAFTSRYSDETTVSSSPPRLCADHNASSSMRSLRAANSSNDANARLVGP